MTAVFFSLLAVEMVDLVNTGRVRIVTVVVPDTVVEMMLLGCALHSASSATSEYAPQSSRVRQMPWAAVARAFFQFEKWIREWESSVRDG